MVAHLFNQTKYDRPVPGKSRPIYRPELDALRFAAFFLIFLNHNISTNRISYSNSNIYSFVMGLARFTEFGLALFFVLSAYLISDLLFRERDKIGTVNLPAFYKRRMLRIWPLYFLGLALGYLASVRAGHSEGPRFLACLLLYGNLYAAKFDWAPNPMISLWSISIEEQFYIFYPWISSKCSRRAIYLCCGVLIAACNLVLLRSGGPGFNETAVWCNSFVQFQLFAAGILMSLTLRQTLPAWNATLRITLAGFAVLQWLFVAFVLRPIVCDAASSSVLVCSYALIASGAVMLMLSVLGIPERSVPNWLRYLGKISFGLYVFHGLGIRFGVYLLGHSSIPFLHHFARVLALVLTIAMASVSYRLFELPFVRLKDKLSIIKGRPVDPELPSQQGQNRLVMNSPTS